MPLFYMTVECLIVRVTAAMNPIEKVTGQRKTDRGRKPLTQEVIPWFSSWPPIWLLGANENAYTSNHNLEEVGRSSIHLLWDFFDLLGMHYGARATRTKLASPNLTIKFSNSWKKQRKKSLTGHQKESHCLWSTAFHLKSVCFPCLG